MNGDIRPPRQPTRPQVAVPPRESQEPSAVVEESSHLPVVAPVASSSSVETPTAAPSEPQSTPAETALPEEPKRHSKYKRWILGLFATLIVVGLALLGVYLFSLQPVTSGDVAKVRITVKQGDLPLEIAEQLEEKKIIRSANAFYVHTRLTGVSNKLQPGTFTLSPAESTPQIATHLLTGNTEEYSVTFYPGATLNIAAQSAKGTPSHRQVLEGLGFSKEEIDEAFAADYSQAFPTLFAGKPADASLEGYVYGQTYRVSSGATAKQILERTFAEFESQIKANNLVVGFAGQGLNLYQGIILSSLVQREVLAPASAEPSADQKQVAQVFFTRLNSGMMLGSDVTYHYAADMMGVARDHTLESPYNTRIKTGLPPTPIASPGITALKAVAAPAAGDYVYFLSGDDDKTYFATTNEEHEANIVNHCAYKCSLP